MMSNNYSGSPAMWGMGLVSLLFLALVVLAIAALARYVFRDKDK